MPFSPFWRLQKFCKRHFLRFDVCRSPANAIFSVLTFAGVLQMPFSPFWHLQEFCKRHGESVGLCRSSASATEIRLAFAGTLQALFCLRVSPQSLFGRRMPEKAMEGTFGARVISASVLTVLLWQRKGKALGSIKTERNQIAYIINRSWTNPPLPPQKKNPSADPVRSTEGLPFQKKRQLPTLPLLAQQYHRRYGA